MSGRIVLGVDPGGRETGVVLRHGEDLLGAGVPVRQDQLLIPDGTYTRQVTKVALQLLDDHGLGPRDPSLIVCVEGVRYWPQQKATQRNLTGLLGAAVVLGAIVERWSNAVVVPPGSGHGGLHEQAYPRPIRPAEHGKGQDRNRHARSAWDCSIHGETMWLQRERDRDARW